MRACWLRVKLCAVRMRRWKIEKIKTSSAVSLFLPFAPAILADWDCSQSSIRFWLERCLINRVFPKSWIGFWCTSLIFFSHQTGWTALVASLFDKIAVDRNRNAIQNLTTHWRDFEEVLTDCTKGRETNLLTRLPIKQCEDSLVYRSLHCSSSRGESMYIRNCHKMHGMLLKGREKMGLELWNALTVIVSHLF